MHALKDKSNGTTPVRVVTKKVAGSAPFPAISSFRFEDGQSRAPYHAIGAGVVPVAGRGPCGPRVEPGGTEESRAVGVLVEELRSGLL